MLYRMYTHWTEQHGLTYKILDYLDGDEAGIKSASILIEGENAYGMLKSRERRPPPRARVPVRRKRPPPDVLRGGRGHSGNHG